MNGTLETLRQQQLVILRRLRNSPLTEFELATQVAEHSGYTEDQTVDKMADWLGDLQADGYIWAGTLSNKRGQQMIAAALTNRGQEIVR